MFAKGSHLTHPAQDSEIQVPDVLLGSAGKIADGKLSIHLPRKGTLKFAPVVSDNDQVDMKTLQYGLATLEGTVLKPLGEASAPTIDLGKLSLPARAWLLVVAKDPTGNEGKLLIPVLFH